MIATERDVRHGYASSYGGFAVAGAYDRAGQDFDRWLRGIETKARETDSPTFTERQAEAWPDVIVEIQRYVDTSTVSADLYRWTVEWQDETRPGRGHGFAGMWCDGEYVAQVLMDVYGYPRVSVAEVTWLHSSSNEECDCTPCVTERDEDPAS